MNCNGIHDSVSSRDARTSSPPCIFLNDQQWVIFEFAKHFLENSSFLLREFQLILDEQHCFRILQAEFFLNV